MKKISIIVVIISFTVVAIPFGSYLYVQYKLNNLEDDTYDYLLEKGYTKNDIVSVESKIKKLSLFTAEVIFADETYVIYDYKKNSSGKVIQIGVSEDPYDGDYQQFKHLE
ncbi:hypothetical protein BN1058_00692 [Paraliobacillus sp. PM-2]|uniref:DUF3139 domain-containing protein n=1 Tax=Paraliobacillus sp. PM-2 TaxID=1462524 RepID=UPI00061C2F1E|nr:DUF3139 domain-containing protein [Paraliobacillus sp. PM-2]CQR46432.1 hypothetical protein BN1058_00692 [Paraliobacillus sp. PM-2]